MVTSGLADVPDLSPLKLECMLMVGRWQDILNTECIQQQIMLVKEAKTENEIGYGLNRDTYCVKRCKGP